MWRYYLNKFQIKIRELKVFFKNNIFKVDDSVHRIALGVAIGLFVAWIPLPGVLMLTVFGLTYLFRANAIAGIAAVWINNPLTIVPMYYAGYLLGRKTLSLLHFWVSPDTLHSRDLYERVYSFLEVGKELWTGCLVIGLLFGLIGYAVTFNVVKSHRQRARG